MIGLLAVAGALLISQGAYIYAKAQLAQVLLGRAFDQSLADGGPVKPWAWADTWPVARVGVPRLQASSIVLHGDSGQALAFGPGHVHGTPVPGDAGMSVLAAHRDTHFAFMDQLQVGDRIDVTRIDGVRSSFVVRRLRVVRFDQSGIDAARSGRWLALTTCWPLDAKTPGPLRYVAEAERLEGVGHAAQ